MRLPRRKSKVAGHWIHYQYEKDPKDKNGQLLNGEADSNNNIIRLRYGLEKYKKAEIVLHENLHIISDNHELNLDERTICTLAVEILNFIRVNKIDFLD